MSSGPRDHYGTDLRPGTRSVLRRALLTSRFHVRRVRAGARVWILPPRTVLGVSALVAPVVPAVAHDFSDMASWAARHSASDSSNP